jgi:hypothetical protein
MTDQIFRKELCNGVQLVTIISPPAKTFAERTSKLDGLMYIDFEVEQKRWYCVTNASGIIFEPEMSGSKKPNISNNLIKQIDLSFFWIKREQRPCEYRVVAKHDFTLIIKCKMTQNNKCFKIPERILFKMAKGAINTNSVYDLIKNAFTLKQKVHDCYSSICEEYGQLLGLQWLSTV